MHELSTPCTPSNADPMIISAVSSCAAATSPFRGRQRSASIDSRLVLQSSFHFPLAIISDRQSIHCCSTVARTKHFLPLTTQACSRIDKLGIVVISLHTVGVWRLVYHALFSYQLRSVTWFIALYRNIPVEPWTLHLQCLSSSIVLQPGESDRTPAPAVAPRAPKHFKNTF